MRRSVRGPLFRRPDHDRHDQLRRRRLTIAHCRRVSPVACGVEQQAIVAGIHRLLHRDAGHTPGAANRHQHRPAKLAASPRPVRRTPRRQGLRHHRRPRHRGGQEPGRQLRGLGPQVSASVSSRRPEALSEVARPLAEWPARGSDPGNRMRAPSDRRGRSGLLGSNRRAGESQRRSAASRPADRPADTPDVRRPRGGAPSRVASGAVRCRAWPRRAATRPSAPPLPEDQPRPSWQWRRRLP